MNVRKQLVAAVAVVAAPLAAFASTSAAVSAGEVEAANRSGAIVSPAAPEAGAPAGDTSRRVHALVVNGASYNEAPAQAAAEGNTRETKAGTAVAPPSREAVEAGTGYVPSSYAAAAPTRG